MPVTSIDPNSALVLIDLQKGITSGDRAHPVRAVVENCRRLAEAFRARDLPVVRVRVFFSEGRVDALKPRSDAQFSMGTPPPDWAEYDPAIPDDPRDIHIVKRQWGAFYGTELELQLRRRGVTGIVIGGIATTYGVESTARDAYERGFQLTFAVDAMTDLNIEAHECALKYVFARIGESGSTDEILAKMDT